MCMKFRHRQNQTHRGRNQNRGCFPRGRGVGWKGMGGQWIWEVEMLFILMGAVVTECIRLEKLIKYLSSVHFTT